MSLQKLIDLLGTEWELIIQGLNDGMEFEVVTLSEKGPETSQRMKKEELCSDNHPITNIDHILWKKLLYANEVTDAFKRYGYVCIGELQLSEDGQHITTNILPYPKPKVIDNNADENSEIEDEGMFFCLMKNGECGYFNARNGSCGYNACTVGGSYATFNIGTYDNVYKYGMDNEGRRWHDILMGVSPHPQ